MCSARYVEGVVTRHLGTRNASSAAQFRISHEALAEIEETVRQHVDDKAFAMAAEVEVTYKHLFFEMVSALSTRGA